MHVSRDIEVNASTSTSLRASLYFVQNTSIMPGTSLESSDGGRERRESCFRYGTVHDGPYKSWRDFEFPLKPYSQKGDFEVHYAKRRRFSSRVLLRALNATGVQLSLAIQLLLVLSENMISTLAHKLGRIPQPPSFLPENIDV